MCSRTPGSRRRAESAGWSTAKRGLIRPRPMAWWSASTDAFSPRCSGSWLPAMAISRPCWVASHGDLETLLGGFNQAYNARRQRVLKGRSPERVVHERLSAAPELVNPRHKPPNNPSVLPNALRVIARAKDVSHPDTYAQRHRTE